MTLDQGLCPWIRLGALPQTPIRCAHNLRIISAHPWQRKAYRVQWPFLQRQFFGTVDWLIERAPVRQTAPIILKDSLSVYRIQSNMQKFKKRKPEKQKTVFVCNHKQEQL